ncbi:MAG TPA: hypothetical protein VKK79_15830 [Candidatus Lokiarchaeia archaeon]|nr:hypothetical protein [Candidatus Lokiarchaeia archaeon]
MDSEAGVVEFVYEKCLGLQVFSHAASHPSSFISIIHFSDIVMVNCSLVRCKGLTNHPGGNSIATLDGTRVLSVFLAVYP